MEMQSIESFKLKEAPNPVIPKPPPTYFPIQNNSTVTSNGSPRHGTGNKPQVNGKETSPSPVPEMTKAAVSPAAANTPNLKPAPGKVAIRIGAYEGEAKQPSKLDFLSQQSRSDRNGTDELANGPVVSRLQNELAATLQRSNLRRKTDGVSGIFVLSISKGKRRSKHVKCHYVVWLISAMLSVGSQLSRQPQNNRR